jgi:internalin A
VTGYRVVQGDADVRSEPLADDEAGIRLWQPISDAGWARIARQVAERPEAELWIEYSTEDLEVLRHVPTLRRLVVRSLSLRSWDGVRHVGTSLERLDMADGTLRPISIAPLGELGLTALHLIGPVRDVEVLGRLTRMTGLGLHSITLPDLSLLLPMRELRDLWIGLGGTSDLGLLPELPNLEELELWRIRGLRDVSILGAMPNLRSLNLQSMSTITELPSFRAATALRRVALDTMKGVTDLSPLAEAPNLEELLLIAMPQLDAESLRPLVDHPSLRRGVWGFGSTRRNVAAYDLLPLGDPPYGHPRFDAARATGTTESA